MAYRFPNHDIMELFSARAVEYQGFDVAGR